MILVDELSELESRIVVIDEFNAEVSARSVGWHVLHSLKVINSILAALKKSNPQRYERKFNFLRVVLFWFNRFPRGKAKAPKIVQPLEEEITLVEINALFEAVRSGLTQIDARDENSYFRHPYFGKLNRKQTKKFLALHTRHHLKIIEDILSRD